MLKKSFSRHFLLVLILLVSSASARADDSSSDNPFIDFWNQFLSLFHHHSHKNGNQNASNPSPTPDPYANSVPVPTPDPYANSVPVPTATPDPYANSVPVPTPVPVPPPIVTTSTTPISIPNPCTPLGAQRIAVIIANYDGSPADTATPDVDYVRELFVGANHDFSVSDFYKTVSKGKAWFQSVTLLGPYHSPKPFVVPDTTVNGAVDIALNQWEADLVNLASADIDFTQIDRVVFLTPNALDNKGQSVGMASGLATQGSCDLDSVNSAGVHHPLAHSWVLANDNYLGATIARVTNNPSNMTTDQINAGIRRLQMLDMAPIAHELGHTFGLGHANQVNRPQQNSTPNQFMNNEILPAANATLYQNSYADPFSVMGAGEIQWLNVAHLSQLGWLDTSQVQEIRSEGTYRIYPLETADGNLKGLKIPRVIQGPNESTVSNLWVEFRQRSTVYDTELNNTHTTVGAIVHYTNPSQPGPNSIWPFETVLLNFHPDGQPVNPYETDLTLTTSWKDDHSMVKIDVVQTTSQFLDIHVSFQP